MRIKTPEDKMRDLAEQLGARLCQVDGRLAIFHRWVDDEKAILKINSFTRRDDPAIELLRQDFLTKHIIPNCCTLDKVKTTRALIEWSDGHVALVDVEFLQFV